MQRPSGRPTAYTVVGVTSVTVTTGVSFLDDDLPDTGGLLPVLCITFIALTAIRRLSRSYEQRLKDLAETMTRVQSERERRLNEQEAQATARMDQATRVMTTASLRVRSAHGRIDMLTDDLTALQASHAELQADYADLTRDHNALVRQALIGRQVPREELTTAAAVGYGPEGQDVPAEHGSRRHRLRGPSTFLTVVETRDRQESC